MDGKPIVIRKPADGIALGIGHVTEDRQRLGLMLNQSIVENTTVVALGRKIKGRLVRLKEHAKLVQPVLESLQVKYHSPWQEASTLSGGNQQKVVLAKWLLKNCDILIFDEPTRGIDVGAKNEIYKLMNRLVSEGKSIIMISSELPELLRLSDRIAVMCEGRITGEIKIEDATQEKIMALATPGV